MSGQPADVTPSVPPVPDTATHEVRNQPGGLVGYNAFPGDRALMMEAVRTCGADWTSPGRP